MKKFISDEDEQVRLKDDLGEANNSLLTPLTLRGVLCW